MLDLAEFRELVGEPEMTDQELVELRAYFYGLAQVIVECFEESRATAPAGTLCLTR